MSGKRRDNVLDDESSHRLESRGPAFPNHHLKVRQKCLTLYSMTQLTVTAKGQVTLRKDLLQHLGLKPGDKLDVALMPDGRAEIRAARPQGPVDAFIGLLAGKAKRTLSIEEMNEIAAQGWAGLRENHR